MKAFAIFAFLLLFFGISFAEKIGDYEMGGKVKLPTTKVTVLTFQKPVSAVQLAPASALMPSMPIKIEIEDFAAGMLDSIYGAGSDFYHLLSGK
jgi:hypothetical protein